ncbi:MAG: VOC family protein [Planctomycetota bacterium]
MTTTAAPFLMFQEANAEEAMRFYVAAFPDGRVVSLETYTAEDTAPEGTVKLGVFEISGLTVKCTDSPMAHEFGFTPSVSLFVDCTTEEELDAIVAALSDGGTYLMPPDNYGFSTKFAWVEDRFGVSWQINLW